ncbi:MAG: 4'-phosphopantetheinyl transferase superfamily protein [Alphaproteobacteria bacterium]|nr:4'-phosphopantetheinyl transferase superfamily protein [Alphaproteobacteria bacterium]
MTPSPTGLPPRPSPDAYEVAFHRALPHGVVSGVVLPATAEPVSDAVLERLHPDEAAHARTLAGFRQTSFVGGRLALRAARRQVGAPLGPVLPDPRGTPTLEGDWVVSVSHKTTLAVGMAARAADGTLGVDLEDRLPERLRIADRVLRPAELAALADLPPHRAWQALLLRFSLKESIYKALDPYVRRYVGFHEAEVDVGTDGRAGVFLHLAQGEGPFAVDARYTWLPGRVLTSVRIRPDVAGNAG